MIEETTQEQEDKKSSKQTTVALAETEGVLYFRGECVSDIPTLLQNQSLISSLEESNIEIRAFSNFYYTKVAGSLHDNLPIHNFFQERNCTFWTKYDPYCGINSWK